MFERAGNQVISLVIQIMLARLLSPQDFGMLAIMVVFIALGNTIVQSGLNTALVQAPSVDESDYSTVFWMSFVVSILLFGILFFIAPSIAEFYSMEAIVWPLRILALILIINAYNSIQVAKITRNLEFRKIFRATVISAVISGGLGVVAAIANAGIWALVIQQLTYQILSCIVLATQVNWRPKLVFEIKRAQNLFSFGWKLLVSGLLDTGYQSLSDLIIGKQFSSFELGLVSQGKKYPQALGRLLDGAIQPVMMSAVSSVQCELTYVKRLVRRALKTSTYFIIPSMAFFALAADPLVRLLLGDQWLPCVPFLQMYCFIYALLPIHTSNLQALNGVGRSDLFLKLEIIKKSYGVAVLLFTAFVVRDAYAIVFGYMLTGVISTFVNAWPNRSIIHYSIREQMGDIVPSFVLTAVSIAIAWPVSLLSLPLAATVAFQMALMAAVYLGLSKAFHIEALDYILQVCKEFVKK